MNGRYRPRKSQSARSPEHTPPKEVRVSELNNLRGFRQAVAPVPKPEREWLTYAEAGEIVGLSRVTLWKLVSAKAIKVRRVGRAVRISRASLDAYMNG